jgi:hypothetical protein
MRQLISWRYLTPAAIAFVAGTAITAAVTAQSPATRRSVPDLTGTWEDVASFVPLGPAKRKGDSVCLVGNDCNDAGEAQRPAPYIGNGPGVIGGLPPAAAGQAAPPNLGAPRPKYRQEFAAKVADLNTRQAYVDPAFACQNPGVPRLGPPDKIMQNARDIVFLYNDVSGSFFRIIPIDGRPHRTDVDPSAMGDSVGRWEGDTLVIDVTSFSDDTWLADDGAFHTRNLHVSERLRKVGDRLEWEAIAEDPAVLAEPFRLQKRILKPAAEELVEQPRCEDQDREHLTNDHHHGNAR